MKISGWGRYNARDCAVSKPRSDAELAQTLANGPAIARGNGRSYGDSAVNENNTVDMRGMNRMISFDAKKGVLVAESGVLLSHVIDAFLPKGWFPWVTPGTKFVTLGGMVAADVHGKNHHHDGTIGNFINWLDVMGPDGTVTRCSPRKNARLFKLTIGGMGLTGVIMRLAMRLRPVQSGWIKQTTQVAPNLAAAMDAFDAADAATYSVAWIDCLAKGDDLGRSLLMLGEHATIDDLPRGKRPFDVPKKGRKTVPMDAPGFALNRYSVRAFNALYYANGRRKAGDALVDWDSYFYPLDSILKWNRIYGRRGFVQFQCVIPDENAHAGLTELLTAISDAGQGSFLAVLKRFGAQDTGFSFPMQGYTLALDFPATTRALALLEELDHITLAHGGRFYLAKDARMRRETLEKSDPRAATFTENRAELGLTNAFKSAQSERLGL